MYNVHEFRRSIKQALDRAKISPVKVLRGTTEVFYVLSEVQFKALQTAAIRTQYVHQQRDTGVHEPTYSNEGSQVGVFGE